MAHQIKFRRDTASNFTSNNPTLAAGEPGFETDSGKVKVGDGSTVWTSLNYLTGTGSVNSVNTGAGLTGGPITNTGTIAVGAGTGITVTADAVAVNMGAFNTDDLPQGLTNLYLNAINLGTFDTDDLPQGTANLYLTASNLGTFDTDDLPEGTANLYLTANGLATFDTDFLQQGTSNFYVNSGSLLQTDITMKQFSESVNALGTTSGSVNLDMSQGSIHTVTLGGSITELTFTNMSAGRSGMLVINNGAGGFTFATTNIIFAGGAPTLTGGASDIDVISFVSDGTNIMGSFTGDYS